MLNFEVTRSISKQDIGQFSAFKRSEIKHGQKQGDNKRHHMILDPQNIVQDTEIIHLCALVQRKKA